MYPVQVTLHSEDIRGQLDEIKQWFERQNLAHGAFHYSMRAEYVLLQIEFTSLRDAAAFAEEFAGRITGLIAEAQ